ncbi:MAG TPA: phosphotransferase [Pyrinomonadaceae bacterium]|jgi:Predicted phosphotransferase related to Ser/Thr protein kinases|nr:phosphotransferase [Pyrinomonadaceae bacterium]
MSSTKQVVSNAFESSASERLARFIAGQGIAGLEITPLTPDASTRKYFRIPWKKGKAVAAVYPEPFDPEFHPYLDVTRLFDEAGIPVPEIFAVDGTAGMIIQEDLGDQQLFQAYEQETEEQCDEYKEQAIKLIAKIQAATEKAYETHSIASRLAFDEAKLSWELEFFFDHYFGSLRHETLRHAETAELKMELNDIAAELASAPRVLCHRDYHASNLMIDGKRRLRVIDHQDARMGPASYDLVSFLLDRRPCPPTLAELRGHRLFFLDERRQHGLVAVDPDDFANEFRLMTIQRGLKATGTFSYQTAVSGRGTIYQPFIQPTLEIVLQAALWLDRFPTLQRMLKERIN